MVKILLVDDRRENLFSLSSLLGDLGVQIFTATSGVEALSLMVDHDFALAILDVQMPEMNGFELAELMRGAERTKGIPIIFVTAAVVAEGFEFRGYESGAVDFLTKPIDALVLRSKVAVFIELAEQKALLQAKLQELEEAKRHADEARDMAERANRLKSAFLANMSHEIRTPLGALMGFAELLSAPEIEEKLRRSYSDVIIRNGRNLVQLINEILDLSKVESGHLEIDVVGLCPRQLAQEVVDLLTPTAEKKGLRLSLRLSERLPARVGSDPLRLRQILTNVIGNALKFTLQGEVGVEVDIEPAEGRRPARLCFRVSDTGVGMDQETVERLFQPFSQADASIARRFGGTGLGLALSKKLARLLGGDLILEESRPGRGSCFLIRVMDLPLGETLDEGERGRVIVASGESGLRGVRVLVVDDSEDNRLLVQMFLEGAGATVEFAQDGSEGMKKAQTEFYDVVLMDIQMPIVDGLEATRALRRLGYSQPIIAFTANAMREERERCREAGCEEYLSKPVQKDLLIQTIRRWATARPRSSAEMEKV